MYSMMDNDPMLLESRLSYPKTLDKSVLIMRAQEIQEVPLPENVVHENVTDTDSGYMEVTERGGMEGVSFDASQYTKLDVTRERRDGARSRSAQADQGPTCLIKAYSKGRLVVNEEQQEGFDDSDSLLKSPAGGSDGGPKGRAGVQKKRKRRSKNWTDEETEILLKAVPQKKKIRS